MKVLITGITGMVGSHLAEYFLSSFPEIEVHGLVRWRSPLRNIQKILPRVRLHQGDLRDLNSLVVLLREVRPDRIHHLGSTVLCRHELHRPGRHAEQQHHRDRQPDGCGADRRNQSAHSYLLVVGGLRAGPARRSADQGIHAASPGEPLRGLEGRRGHDRLSVRALLSARSGPNADVHPYRTASRRCLRGKLVRASRSRRSS